MVQDSAMTSDQLLQFLSVRNWRLQRAIIDHNSGTVSNYSAEAELCRTESGFLYEESGELEHNNQIFEMKRQYLYLKGGPHPLEQIRVCFADGRPFYTIDCGKLPDLRFHHLCDPDSYSGEMKIGSSVWQTYWKVVGPKKDLEIQSNYT
jgi:hypothetical protein